MTRYRIGLKTCVLNDTWLVIFCYINGISDDEKTVAETDDIIMSSANVITFWHALKKRDETEVGFFIMCIYHNMFFKAQDFKATWTLTFLS